MDSAIDQALEVETLITQALKLLTDIDKISLKLLSSPEFPAQVQDYRAYSHEMLKSLDFIKEEYNMSLLSMENVTQCSQKVRGDLSSIVSRGEQIRGDMGRIETEMSLKEEIKR
jgi:DNA-binding transcriptional MerR regulator